jgi:1-acyl-sn-glycerol-3-phosphate acyltransferase
MRLYRLWPLLFQKLIWIPTRLLLGICGRLEVVGLENLEGIRGPVIFAANHSSEIDPFMVPASLPFFSRFSPLFYAVRDKSFYDTNGWRKHLFNTWFINLWGGYEARAGIRDYGASLERHIELLQNGQSFCIFPEGGITKTGYVGPAKGGISYLAHSSPSTIVPVAISGVYGMSPMDFFLRRRSIVVKFGTPIDPRSLYAMTGESHASGEGIWKKEADVIMAKVAELLSRPSPFTYTHPQPQKEPVI